MQIVLSSVVFVWRVFTGRDKQQQKYTNKQKRHTQHYRVMREDAILEKNRHDTGTNIRKLSKKTQHTHNTHKHLFDNNGRHFFQTKFC